MKYLIAGIAMLPLLTSCEVVQQEYYDQGYYNPPPQVEVVRPYRYAQDGRIYRAGPHDRVYYRHGSSRPAPQVEVIRPSSAPVPQGKVYDHRPSGQAVVTPAAPVQSSQGRTYSRNAVAVNPSPQKPKEYVKK